MDSHSIPTVLRIRNLTAADVEQALHLSIQAGWNQLPADWKRFLDCSPEGCFGGWVGEQLVATTCVATYSSTVSWIGMVLVDENHRQQGFGTELFERGLQYAREQTPTTIGLDATTYGAPMYREYGFQDGPPIERWSGRLQHIETPLEAKVLLPRSLQALQALDREVLGVDRSDLLARMLSEVGTTPIGIFDDDDLTSFAVIRPGFIHPQVGPIIAPDSAHLSALLNRIEDVLFDPTVIVDSVRKAETADRFWDHGLERKRELVRMTHESTEPLLDAGAVRAAIGFAWG
jgi:GNAT superfamily N-acetyltransferase